MKSINDNNKHLRSKKEKKILEIDRVYNKTRKIVHELNADILRQRDDIEEVLLNYEETLKDLLYL